MKTPFWCVGSFMSVAAAALGQCLDEAKLVQLSESYMKRSGTAVALSGSRAIVGSVAGGVTVYAEDAAGWAIDGELPGGSYAGYSGGVAIDGGRAFVGNIIGPVREYLRGPSGWQEVASIPNPAGDGAGVFGVSMAFHGTRLAVLCR